ncbi:MAG: hypothetical protein P8X70_03060, partial [Nanoarchaeota archaeon]
MKKRVLFGILFLSLILSLSFASAEMNQSQIDKAYDCLEQKVEGKCSSLSLEQQIFSLLAIGECESEIVANSDYMSDTKITAQSILALDKVNTDTSEAQEWLSSQNATPEGIDWLLQIESTEETICTINYGGTSYSGITINNDKTISAPAGPCLTLYPGDYWLRIAQTQECYNYDFEISCDSSFSTNLLYKKTQGTNSDVIYVSGKTNSASGEGTTTERVNSLCFTQDGSCDYEASLWSALVLNYKGYDVSSYLPYLITLSSDYPELIPESFLYSLTNSFRNELLLKQLPSGYWQESNNRYYDTALALMPFQNKDLEQKDLATDWLSEVQNNDGCWNNGNILDTAFILYSLWPQSFILPGGIDEGLDCESSGYFCISPMSCSEAQGEELEEYSQSCFGTNICCTQDRLLGSCEEQGGEICGSGETCTTSVVEASDTSECCLGSCQVPTETTECELYGDGTCRSSCY